VRARLLLLLATVLAVVLAAPARALEPAEADAVRALAASDVATARRAVAEGLGGRPQGTAAAEVAARRAAVLLLAADAVEARDQADPTDDALDARVDRLASRMRPDDLELLRELERALGDGRYLLAPLLAGAYQAIDAGLPRDELLALAAQTDDERARDMAVRALAEGLAALRTRVLEGGALTPDEQAAVADPTLIALLIERLGDRPGRGATDHVPADALQGGAGFATALHALASVEAAALPALEEAAAAGRPGAREALAAVRGAVGQRLRRHPESTWCSAKGDPPRSSSSVACPGPCARPVPPAALFCPACGARVRVVCARCGGLTESGSRHCSSCGARGAERAAAEACARCRAAFAGAVRYCSRCGARRPEGGRRP
jgi:hypothetical protein